MSILTSVWHLLKKIPNAVNHPSQIKNRDLIFRIVFLIFKSTLPPPPNVTLCLDLDLKDILLVLIEIIHHFVHLGKLLHLIRILI